MPAEFSMGSPVREPAGPPPSAEDAPTSMADVMSDGGDQPPSPTYYGNKLWDVEGDDRPAEVKDEPKPESKVEAKPEQPAGQTSADLEGKLRASEERLATLEQRLRDTQSWGNQAHMSQQVAQAIVQARMQQDHIERQLAAQREAEKFPALADPDELLTDGKNLVAAIERAANWSRDTTVGRISPHLAALQQRMDLVALAQPLVEDYARTKAHSQLMKSGLDDEQATKLLDRAYNEVINREQNAQAYRLNPEAISWAAKMIMDREGAPIKATPKTTPTAGKGDAAPPKRRDPLSSTARKAASEVEKMFKIKFNDEQMGDLARMNGRA